MNRKSSKIQETRDFSSGQAYSDISSGGGTLGSLSARVGEVNES